jgi:PilZ domain-containing protein
MGRQMAKGRNQCTDSSPRLADEAGISRKEWKMMIHNTPCADRRGIVRQRCSLPVEFEAAEAGVVTLWQGLARDISERGLGVTASRRYEPGKLVTLSIGQDSPLVVPARVVKVRPQPCGGWLLGFRFLRELNLGELETCLETSVD